MKKKLEKFIFIKIHYLMKIKKNNNNNFQFYKNFFNFYYIIIEFEKNRNFLKFLY